MGGMEGSVVLFNPRIHLFACTHPSVSNTFDCNALFVYKHQSTALCFKHVWIVVLCLGTRISLQPCVSNMFGLCFPVGVHASVNSPLLRTRLIMVACLLTSISVLSQNGYG